MNDDPPPIDCDVDFERRGRQVSWLRLLHSDDRHAYGVVPVPIAVLANREGPTLLLGAGTHGDEYEGQIILGRLIRELDLDALHGRLIVFPALNYPAVRAGTRVSPLDGGNPNRSFPGEGGGPPTRAIADYVTREILPRCDAGIDLHSGGSTTEFLPCAFLCTPPERALASRVFELVEAFGAPGSAAAPGALSEVPGEGAATSLPARPGPIPGGPVVSRWCYAASASREEPP